MAQLLDGAVFRIEWAGKRLDELNARVEGLLDSDDDRVIPTFESHGPEKIVIGLTQIKPPPPDLSVRVGEVVYHLRSALDYLTYALARHDSGKSQSKTQFPIMDEPKAFQACRDTYLSGISDAHVALFEPYQPYKGCDWTRLLRRLSNPDKHRELITTTMHAQQTVVVFSTAAEREPENPGDMVLRTEGPGGSEVEVKVTISAQITLENGAPIVEALQVLKSQVAQTVEAFNPEFK